MSCSKRYCPPAKKRKPFRRIDVGSESGASRHGETQPLDGEESESSDDFASPCSLILEQIDERSYIEVHGERVMRSSLQVGPKPQAN